MHAILSNLKAKFSASFSWTFPDNNGNNSNQLSELLGRPYTPFALTAEVQLHFALFPEYCFCCPFLFKTKQNNSLPTKEGRN